MQKDRNKSPYLDKIPLNVAVSMPNINSSRIPKRQSLDKNRDDSKALILLELSTYDYAKHCSQIDIINKGKVF